MSSGSMAKILNQIYAVITVTLSSCCAIISQNIIGFFQHLKAFSVISTKIEDQEKKKMGGQMSEASRGKFCSA